MVQPIPLLVFSKFVINITCITLESSTFAIIHAFTRYLLEILARIRIKNDDLQSSN